MLRIAVGVSCMALLQNLSAKHDVKRRREGGGGWVWA